MSKLVICEKPSVAKSIASALGVTSRADGYFEGGGWLISWCIGHLVGLADAAAYDDRYKKWRYEDLPILPAPFHYVVSEEKADQFHILRSLMERPDVTELVNACDAGREGELIFRLVYEAAGCSKPFSRLWISSMEDAAIREGFADLHPGADYDPLYQSALCRQKADWLIGINASRLFSVLYHRTLNIGRVQTPTLAMLADRDSKIVLFRKEKYHYVRLALEGAEAVSDRIVSPEDAQAIRDACDGQRAVCVSLVREKKTENPPKLYSAPGVHFVFSPEDATQIHFDVIRSFDRPLIHSELLEKMADKNVKTELDWQLYQLQRRYLDYQVNIGNRIIECLTSGGPDGQLRAAEMSYPKTKFQNLMDDLFGETGKKIIRKSNEILFEQDGDILYPYQLSSGEKQILVILLTVLVQDNRRGVLFMDEPEVSLHVEWQQRLISLIRQLNPNVQIVLTTHSPAVIMDGWLDAVTEVSDITK